MAFTVTRLNKNIDRMCQFYERLRGSADSASAYGLGRGSTALTASDAWANLAVGALTDMRADVVAAADITELNALSNAITNGLYQADAAKIARRTLGNILVRNEGLVRGLAISDVTTIEQYLAYQNTGAGGTWAALQHPAWRELFYEWKRVYPAVSNVYFPITSGSTFRGTTYTNGLRKLIVGTGQTAGGSVDTTKYCGGFPYLLVSSFAGAAATVTVTGTQWNRTTGATTAGKTWTVSVTGDGSFALSVGTADANSLLVAVSDITAGGAITASTVIVAECRAPTSRLAVPF